MQKTPTADGIGDGVVLEGFGAEHLEVVPIPIAADACLSSSRPAAAMLDSVVHFEFVLDIQVTCILN
jgi:hypothetical protein